MARPAIPSGLYTSVSQVKCWLRCPRQFELKYVRGVPPAFVPVALAFGSAFHEALAAHYQEIKVTGEPLRRDVVIDVFRAAWDKGSSGPIPLQATDEDDEEVGALTDKGVSMLHAFCENATASPAGMVVVGVERRFEVEIHDPDTGEVLDEKLVGVIDLIVNDDGDHVVVEHKTSAKKYAADQLRFDVQPTAYRLAAREMGLGDVRLRFQVVTKAKVPQVQIAEVTRNEQDEDDLLRTVQGVLRGIDAGIDYPVRGWACRSCPWAGPCGGP